MEQPQVEKKEKKPKKDFVIPPKKPKLSKAERRALQEAQRAAKGQKADGSITKKKSKNDSSKDQKAADKSSSSSNDAKSKSDVTKVKEETKNDTLTFFSHLPPFKDYRLKKGFTGIKLNDNTTSASIHASQAGSSATLSSDSLHPAVLDLGLQYAEGSIRGSNKRCKAMLQTFKIVIQDYTIPSDTRDYRQDLENRVLKPAFTYWTTKCRHHSVTMGNAFTFLKLAVANLNRDLALQEAKSILCEGIDAYMHERIDFADKAICKFATSKISNGDVILTYGKNDLIRMILYQAIQEEKKDFRVIVVDSRPLLEGKDMIKDLIDAGIECTYILINSVSYVMKEVTKVFLGGSALMSDGSILGRVGTASIAMMAMSLKVPVLVCCETYKISSRVQLESITGNELGDPEGLTAPSTSLKKWKEENPGNLRLLNLLYDLTPNEFVSGIVTEMGILPPTSVAVLLREMNPENSGFKGEAIYS